MRAWKVVELSTVVSYALSAEIADCCWSVVEGFMGKRARVMSMSPNEASVWIGVSPLLSVTVVNCGPPLSNNRDTISTLPLKHAAWNGVVCHQGYQ